MPYPSLHKKVNIDMKDCLEKVNWGVFLAAVELFVLFKKKKKKNIFVLYISFDHDAFEIYLFILLSCIHSLFAIVYLMC